MGKFIKHNSNYIRTTRHQFLKGGSTIFERDWVTVGSQLNFGPGKIPYYNNGNFIFTTSPIPNYQKKYKNGVTVGTWTYEDVMDASSKVNQIQFDEYTEDIRSYAYYGSCVELVRATIENIINTFPGNITVSDEELGIFKNVEEFVCGGEESQEIFERVKKNGKLCFTLNNPFDINIFLKDVQLTQYDNELRYLTYSYDKYQISTNGGSSFSDIESYEVVMRKMYEKEAPPCDETIKEYITSASFGGSGQTQSISLEKGNYFIEVNDQQKLNNWTNLCYNNSDSICFSISQNAISIKTDEEGNVKLVLSNGSEQQINGVSAAEESVKIDFYKELKIERVYKYYQMFDDVEYEQTYKSQGWVESTCIMDFWLPDSVFLNRCDEYQRNILYSEISNIGENQPVYTVTINGSIKIEGYIYNRQVIPLVVSDYQNMVIQPKDESIEEYFNNLKGFEKQLLTRKTKPLYTNYFITPIEYDLGFLYYKRTYTWPSNGYCIDIMSPLYLDFVSKLGNLAALYDELWTDNLWRRMTHEAIKNYDWTYTREFSEGEEEDNVNGGERMHKVLNIIGRVFDDIKLSIDTIKRNNTLTYNGDRNMPNALISDKLDLKGWDIYSTIPTYKNEDDEIVSASEETITQEVLDTFSNETYDNNWYPTIDANRISFADVDIEFMRRLLLSTKRIWQTKGTRHSIDMVMGMFGYGNMDEECYTITETYRSFIPKEYGEEETGFGDTIVRLNAAKKNELLYDEDASGIPVGSFIGDYDSERQPITYLIPFYDQRKIYDGNLYFQTKGGWCYHKDGEESENDMSKWTETLSYLHVTSQISDLLSVHPNSVKNGDIYYVVNVNDYIEYAENAEDTLYSHFFVLEDDYNPESFSSWTNINLNEEFYEESADFSEDDAAKYIEYSKKANYLDSIVPYNIGNNPHVGYGKYDMGEEFFEYMKQPFKYSFDGHNNFETIEELQEAEGITFEEEDIPHDKQNDKIQIIDGVENVNNDLNVITVPSYGGKQNLKYKDYKPDKIKEWIKKHYYLNSKVIYLTNKIDNNEYKKYFLNVIIKYLMQVIPSTAIFVLENFEPSDGSGDDTPKKYRVHFYDTNGTTQIHSEKVEEGQSVDCYGGNDYYVRGDSSRTKVSCPYGPINSETFLVKWSEPIVYYNVHFLDSNGTTELYTQSVEKGKNVACYGGNDYYVRGDSSKRKVSCPYGPINSETWLVKWVEEIIRYNVTFYDTNGTSIINATTIEANHTVNNYGGYDYYLKEDSTKTKITTWPYTITRNTNFVRWTPPIVYYDVTFYDTDGTSVLNRTSVEENHTINKYGGYDYYLKGDSTQTKITTWPYTITRNTDFVKWVEPTVYYNVDFYENENDTTPIHTEQIEEGQPVNRYQDSDWYLMDDDNKQPVNFPYVINGPTKFVRIKQFTVRWDKQGEIMEAIEHNVNF